MKRAIKQKWIAALRGGLFKQGKGRLRNGENECCCLGVLCDIVDPKGWSNFKAEFNEYDYRNRWSYPPPVFLNHVGLTDVQIGELGKLNDDEGRSFIEIADYIEKNL